MRIWSLHPKYLDSKGLVALWRETLLAQNVLLGKTKGYTNHPQLLRFKNCNDPVAAIGFYLHKVADEADKRNYNFNRSKILQPKFNGALTVTSGQISYELKRLFNKLEQRDPEKLQQLATKEKFTLHPLFTEIKGYIETWEVVKQ